MSYALTIVWRERTRFLPAMLAVAFSATLIAVQCGLLLGLLAVSSRPIDNTRADIWIGSPSVPSLGFGHPIPSAWRSRLAAQPEIERSEVYLFGFATWSKPGGGTEQCYVMGSRLEEGSIGAVAELTPALRRLLTAPGNIIVDEGSLNLLGLQRGLGEVAEVNNQRVRVVGLLRTIKTVGLAPGIFCSLRTAAILLPFLGQQPGHTTYVLGRCRRAQDAPAVAARLQRENPLMTVMTQDEFSARTRWHWLLKSKAGIHLGFCALLGLIVGAVVTSQTLYAATMASLREFAVLRALGIPRWQISRLVFLQSFWIGIVGIAVGFLVILGIERMVAVIGLDLLLPSWLLAATAGSTLFMACGSGLLALRSLQQADPAVLLR
jgi:putative ABC transport system permease protein